MLQCLHFICRSSAFQKPTTTHAYSCLSTASRPFFPFSCPSYAVLNCAACLMRQLCAKGANGTYDGTENYIERTSIPFALE